MKKDVVAGLGEIGLPIFKIISKSFDVEGFDINPDLIPKSKKNLKAHKTRFLHICIPFNTQFIKNVLNLNKKFLPESIIIHSTIKPKTTKNLQQKISVPVIYSATRGVHKRMINDLKRYTKFFALDDEIQNSKLISRQYVSLMHKSGIKTQKISTPLTLELGKILCDTSYYGWLINFAQITKIISDKHNVDFDEMWTFADEIHKFLGNRPKMFPGFISGHCVIPNLTLINEKSLDQINEINEFFKNFSND